ncbi:hypothetical protein CEQ90_10165 [Lewinellaceae bacterium SD302]|nr:hypothetical protein CEQ90_10165 [Lewinellaceae bacterium SD302]
MSKAKKRPSVTDRHGKRKSKSTGGTKWGILIILGIGIVAFIYSSIPKASNAKVGPQFTKEGELTISRDGASIATLDIEIADNRDDITQGLMYRRSMEEDQGMLFLMDAEEPQSFWMLNTYIPLDIIFIDAERKIVNVAANTTPMTTDPVPSTGPAKYVLEVNAGYGQRKGLRPGDQIDW